MKEKVKEYVDWVHFSEERLNEIESTLKKKQFEKDQIQNLPATVRHSMWRFKNLILKFRTKNRHIKYNDLDNILKDIEQLQNQKDAIQKDLTGYLPNDFVANFTSDIVEHSSNPSYINDFINQMPFDIRSNFINNSVYDIISKHMRGFNKDVTDESYTNIVNVYESNIEAELRQRINNSSFQETCEELHQDSQYVANPYGIRNVIPAYNCINIGLYRLDQELANGRTFGKELASRTAYDRNNSLEAILDHYYKFNRTTYDYHEQVKQILDEGKNLYKSSLKFDVSPLEKVTQVDTQDMNIQSEKHDNLGISPDD